MRYLRDDYLGYLLGFVLFVSCSHEQDKKQRTSSINLRQQYVKTNKFLDVDMSKFLPGTQTQAFGNCRRFGSDVCGFVLFL